MGLVRLRLITVVNNRMCVWIIRGGCKPNDAVKRVTLFVCVCLLQDASGHSNVLKAGKAEELKNARKRRPARKAN